MLTTRGVKHQSLGKEGVPIPRAFDCKHYSRKTRFIHESRTQKRTARPNEPEVNQTKPELPLSAEDLCR
jgi:hypothetical protein